MLEVLTDYLSNHSFSCDIDEYHWRDSSGRWYGFRDPVHFTQIYGAFWGAYRISSAKSQRESLAWPFSRAVSGKSHLLHAMSLLPENVVRGRGRSNEPSYNRAMELPEHLIHHILLTQKLPKYLSNIQMRGVRMYFSMTWVADNLLYLLI